MSWKFFILREIFNSPDRGASGQPQSQHCRGAWRILQDASNNNQRQLNGLQESAVALV